MTENPPEVLTFTAGAEDAGERLDLFLARRCPGFSRNQIQDVLVSGQVEVDGRPRPKGFRLSAGSRICFRPPAIEPLRAVSEDIPLKVIYQDEDLLVVDKPAGMVVHPAPGHRVGTLVNALLHHCGRLPAAGDGIRPGIVHRLDRDTTGLLVVALTDAAHRALAAQLKERRVNRVYLALSWGCWPDPAGIIEGNIGRSRRDRQKMAVVESGGRSAVTRYEVAEDFGFVQLCRVTLQTGRTHQIRVHFAHRSHPLVGDPVYGDDGRARNVRPVEIQLAANMVKLAGRQMLHAAELALTHPRTGRALDFRSPLPPDLADVLEQLRAPGAGKDG